MNTNYRKEFLAKKSLLLYLSYYMDIETIDKMLLLNKKFYSIYSDDIVWSNIFHRHFTKIRIIEKPNFAKVTSLTEKNQLGKKRKRFISAVKASKDKDFSCFRPSQEDCYNVVITGYCEYMPLESAIKEIYGPHQDIFSFFNCFFFYDETISLLSYFSCPNITNNNRVKKTDCFLFAFNRNFPLTFRNINKAEELITKFKCMNIILLENTYVPNDLDLLVDRLTSEELDELKVNLMKSDHEKAPQVDEFLSKYRDITHLKVNVCSNESINEVFYNIIKIAQNRVERQQKDEKGPVIGEKDLIQKIKDQPIKDITVKSIDDINNIKQEDLDRE